MTEDWNDLIFSDRYARESGEPFVTIIKTGTIIFTANFLKKFSDVIKDKSQVKVGYSKKMNAIAVQFIDKKDSINYYKVSDSKKSFKSCAVASFLKSIFGKDLTPISKRYPVHLETISKDTQAFIIRFDVKPQDIQ